MGILKMNKISTMNLQVMIVIIKNKKKSSKKIRKKYNLKSNHNLKSHLINKNWINKSINLMRKRKITQIFIFDLLEFIYIYILLYIIFYV